MSKITEFDAACPHCGRVNELHTDPDADSRSPEPGDISICWNCAGIAQYTETLSMQLIPEEQHAEIMLNPQLRKMLAIVRRAQAERLNRAVGWN